MQSVDITSNYLTELGIIIKKELSTIIIQFNNGSLPKRFSIYPNDWNKTTRQIENKLEDDGFKADKIQPILSALAENYSKLVTDDEDDKGDNNNGNNKSSSSNATVKLDDITPEEWQSKLHIKYEALQEKIRTSVMPLPQLILPLEFALSVKNVLNLADNTLPFAGFLLGAPSSLKTVTVELFRDYWHSIYKDDFSPRAWVSHYSGATSDDLGKNDLLPLIQHKLFLTPELAPLFSGSEDDIKKSFGVLTRLLDGKGLETHSGTQGSRGYHGDYNFSWLGAVVDVSNRVYRMMGNLGPKMYFLRLARSYHTEKDLVNQIKNPRFVQDRNKIEELLIEYLKWFEASPMMEDKYGLPKIVWDDNKNDSQALKYIAKLADLIGPLRGVAEVQDTEDSHGSSYAYSNKIVEEPWRANQQLYNLARGHALIEGRNYITMTDIPLLVKVVLSTAPIARVAVFDLLLAYRGTLRTADIKDSLGINPQTVYKTMLEFELLEIADVKKDGSFDNSPLEMRLKRNFRWCLGRHFRQLREGFAPARKGRKRATFGKRSSNRGDNVEKDSANQVKRSGVVYDNIHFWEVFYKIADNERTVSVADLKRDLIASGYFDAGGAYQQIKDRQDKGLLKQIDADRVRLIIYDKKIGLENNSQANMSKADEK